MMWNRIKQLFIQGLAIDLGTANTLIYSQGRGIILNEPSAIAVNRFNGNVVAVGQQAMTLIGRTPRDVMVCRPIENGVVANYDLAEQMLLAFLRQAGQSRNNPWRLCHVVVGRPNRATPVEDRGIQEAVLHAGASRVWLVDEGVAAAIGAGVLFQDSRARLVVDIGGGTTNISLVSSVGTILSHSIDVAGLAMDRVIREYICEQHKVLIGEPSAEAIKIEVGSALPSSEARCVQVIGKNLIDHAPYALEIYSDEIFHALDRLIGTIIENIQFVITEAPPETLGDLFETGIVLTGGGSLLRDLEARLSDELELPVSRVKRPLEAVVLGAGYLLDHAPLLDRFRISEDVPSWEFETEVDDSLAAPGAESFWSPTDTITLRSRYQARLQNRRGDDGGNRALAATDPPADRSWQTLAGVFTEAYQRLHTKLAGNRCSREEKQPDRWPGN